MINVIIIGLLLLIVNMLFIMVCVGGCKKNVPSISNEDIEEFKQSISVMSKEIVKLKSEIKVNNENVGSFLTEIESNLNGLGIS